MPQYRLPRRQVLASLGAAPVVSLLSSHAQAVMLPLPDDMPAVQSRWMLDIVLRLRLTARASAKIGSAIILGGVASGPLMNGEVLPGALEWSHDPARGVLRLSAHYDLQDDNGLRIHVSDRATVAVKAASGQWDAPFSTSPDLQLVSGPATACPDALYLGRLDARQLDAGRLRLNVHRVV
jgi:hypothetical protein